MSANLPREVRVDVLAERSQWADPAKHSGDGLMVCSIYSSQGTAQTGCSHLASVSHPGLVTTVTMTPGLDEHFLDRASTGQRLLVVCNPHRPDVSLQLTRALFLRVLVQELPQLLGSRKPSNGSW